MAHRSAGSEAGERTHCPIQVERPVTIRMKRRRTNRSLPGFRVLLFFFFRLFALDECMALAGMGGGPAFLVLFESIMRWILNEKSQENLGSSLQLSQLSLPFFQMIGYQFMLLLCSFYSFLFLFIPFDCLFVQLLFCPFPGSGAEDGCDHRDDLVFPGQDVRMEEALFLAKGFPDPFFLVTGPVEKGAVFFRKAEAEDAV